MKGLLYTAGQEFDYLFLIGAIKFFFFFLVHIGIKITEPGSANTE